MEIKYITTPAVNAETYDNLYKSPITNSEDMGEKFYNLSLNASRDANKILGGRIEQVGIFEIECIEEEDGQGGFIRICTFPDGTITDEFLYTKQALQVAISKLIELWYVDKYGNEELKRTMAFNTGGASFSTSEDGWRSFVDSFNKTIIAELNGSGINQLAQDETFAIAINESIYATKTYVNEDNVYTTNELYKESLPNQGVVNQYLFGLVFENIMYGNIAPISLHQTILVDKDGNELFSPNPSYSLYDTEAVNYFVFDLRTDIDINAGNIATNTSNISQNTTEISTNATNIFNNTTDISNLDTRVGNNELDIDNIIFKYLDKTPIGLFPPTPFITINIDGDIVFNSKDGSVVIEIENDRVVIHEDLTMFLKQIKNLGAPTDVNDATNKDYVDTKIDEVVVIANSKNAGTISLLTGIETIIDPVEYYTPSNSDILFWNNEVIAVQKNMKVIIELKTILDNANLNSVNVDVRLVEVGNTGVTLDSDFTISQIRSSGVNDSYDNIDLKLEYDVVDITTGGFRLFNLLITADDDIELLNSKISVSGYNIKGVSNKTDKSLKQKDKNE